jgi:hypothetical protein
MATAVVQIEGVLMRDDQNLGFVSRVPIQPAFAFYRALLASYRVVLVTLEPDGEKVSWWLKSQGLSGFAEVLLPKARWVTSAPDVVSRSVAALRALPTDVGVVVTGDPRVAARLLQEGVTTNLFAHPRFTRPDFRPEGFGGIRPWAEIEAEVDKQIAAGDRPTAPITAEVIG